ncbi:hypothetical protein AMATHDRAFT_190526 [Amanita thiersii Skay4041]|uniref:BRCA1-associated protein n=1 Tax=Amanita thiersii Skay4041 TaxID=703135 RepID=A0A2A9NLQ8_9AGAR|nr:hypothetical protein AMATHDRAFT_190526 [Amanita thiersii Skay4041]
MQPFHFLISLHHRDQNTKLFVPNHIFAPLPNHSPSLAVSRKAHFDFDSKSQIKDYRFGPIHIDWMDIIDSRNQSHANPGKRRDRKQGPAEATFIPNQHTKIGSTNLPEGIIHIFRDSASSLPSDQLEANSSTSCAMTHVDGDGVILGVLAVPPLMTPSDFLAFVAPASEGMSHIRIIRDSAPNRSIALIKFANPAEATEFAEAYNGKPFDTMQPEICHVVHVLSVQIQPDDLVSQAISRISCSQGSMYELPTCPVCLERMDSAVTGLITVPCSHTFHCMCLSKWGDSRCPVCRYSQNLLSSHPSSAASRSSIPIPFTQPSSPVLSVCSSCSSTTNLWICLICGNIGCGRYGHAHAHAHYQATTHLYALELETQRVWDYAGDGYVHRLIQNKADGKLVELPSAASTTGGINNREGGLGPSQSDALTAEKIEAIGIEYSYLLTSQLDSQRSYYEEQIGDFRKQIDELRKTMERLTCNFEAERKKSNMEMERRGTEYEARLAEVGREKAKAEQRGDKVTELARKLERQLKEEQVVSEGLMKNLKMMREQVENVEKDKAEYLKRVGELEDQVRDVMFFLEAKNKIESGDGVAGEAAGGSIEIAPVTAGKNKNKRNKR